MDCVAVVVKDIIQSFGLAERTLSLVLDLRGASMPFSLVNSSASS